MYILLYSDKSYYIGHTDNIEKRVSEHKQRTYPCCYTKSRLPVRVVFIQRFTTRHEAFVAERQNSSFCASSYCFLLLVCTIRRIFLLKKIAPCLQRRHPSRRSLFKLALSDCVKSQTFNQLL